MWSRRSASVGKGLAAGIAAGLVASWTMNQFQYLWNFIQTSRRSPRRETRKGNRGDDTTVRAAQAVSEGVFGHELTEQEKRWAGPLLHYAFGALVGGIYGAAAEKRPEVTAGQGLPFGAVFWLTADETAVSLLGLSEPPNRYPPRVHLYAFVSHLVFGATTELVRRSLRERL
jgi:putative membrane protein